MSWIYKGQPVTTPPDDAIGFVYIIESKSTRRKYIGKKQCRDKNGKLMRFDNYWGSSNQLLKDIEIQGESNFTRNILCWCPSKSALSYMEASEQFRRRVLSDSSYYNGIINCRIPANPGLSNFISKQRAAGNI